MSDYLLDDQPIDEVAFTARACDPRASVVVEACAGSGKTWLLVGRIIRLLLAGNSPGEILAITFTRRAAQEMRARLLKDLQDLAQADDDAIAAFLALRGMVPAAAQAAVGAARSLYERVVTARVPLAIETFHGWFWHLIERAPLGAGVPFAPALLETSDRLRADAWLHFNALLLDDRHAAERAAWLQLIDDVGEDAARGLLLQFLHKRAEWWSFAAGNEDGAVARALAPLRAGGTEDPRLGVRTDNFVAALQAMYDIWCALAKAGKPIADAIDAARRWLDCPAPETARDFRDACVVVLTKELAPRQALLPERIAAQLERRGDGTAVPRYRDAHAFVVTQLAQMLAAHRTWRALKLNEAALACGRLLIGAYQHLKDQALDFTDLEWHALRLLSDPDNAAYMQARLDARYRHILIDEFQDTNPLQWQVLQAWLAAYGEPEGETGAAATIDRPTVFIVGDPKQSIYRFRRAEPRVFNAALELLQRDFGAAHLRTNVTRRNAQAVVDVLNLALPGRNRLYQEQSTRACAAGAFVLLPLAPSPQALPPQQDAGLRDVLTTPRAERDNDTRYREGRVFANEIVHWVGSAHVNENGTPRAARWSDVLVLVRRRTYLLDYERALRDAGVPFISDRRGGLLATLEADDLTALLEFLSSPFDDLRLAHALRSPIVGAADDDLMQLAVACGASWWERLQSLEAPSPVLARARGLLARWLELAGVLPVHDLLDRIYFEGDVRRRYAAVAPGALHAQVQANLDAFIELALAVDAGRYPSLSRFIDELAGLKRHGDEEAPDEGTADSGDAVRVMTIHGAKGLEAEIVVLADAHAVARSDAESVLVVWPPRQPMPEHVSLVARGAHDDARAVWFRQEEAQQAQEDWNLLYVAATRAKQVLIVSGSAPARGTPDDTWYTRLQCAAHLSLGAAAAQTRPPVQAWRRVHEFLPAPLPTGERRAQTSDTDPQRLGRAWHALLERAAGGVPADTIARLHGLTRQQAQLAAAAADRVRAALPQFFGAHAEAELELMSADGELLRVDRLIERDDALWIVDFKWRVTDAERAQYEAQVRRYADVLRAIRHDKPVRMGLVTAEGSLIEIAA
jgi:ATP-dependent helicase/nuclease subunit A